MVVAAVGNSGPYPNTISEPAREAKVLGVGASCNLSPLCLSSSLKIYPEEFLESYPLNGSNVTEGELKGELVFVKYARERDLQNVNLTGKIALAERGGDIGELVYFAEKELNVAKRGAKALIIYNNMPGIFLGTLVGSGLPDWLRPPYYYPTLPVVSISREDGLKLVKRLESGEKIYINLSVKIDPDKVAPFSSRGPSSFFTVKPNLLAPGSYINTTYINNSYYIISGTSFASPHVAGGLALIKEKYPYLSVDEMYDLISETSKPITNPMGNIDSIFSQGSGRLDLLNALTTPIFLSPSYLVLHLAKGQDLDIRDIKINYLKNYEGKINFTLYFPYQDKVEVRVNKEDKGFKIFFKALNFTKGIYEGRFFFNLSNNSLTIPFVVFVNSLGLNWIIKDDVLEIYPKVEEFNQITATLYYPDGSKDIRKSDERSVSFPLKGEGEYWIELEALIQGKREIGRAIVFVKGEKKMSEILTSSNNLLNGSSEEKEIFTFEINLLLLILSTISLLTILYIKVKRRKKEDLPPYPNTLSY
ncbi:Minor extracellular protease vpr [archaeon HR06]|nr:Minor extracellular protease vpr [archaeon HR06]